MRDVERVDDRGEGGAVMLDGKRLKGGVEWSAERLKQIKQKERGKPYEKEPE